jgi:hypothetical protein
LSFERTSFGRRSTPALATAMSVQLPSTIAESLGAVVGALAAEGFDPVAVQESSSFGDFAVTFSNGHHNVMLCRDRGQYIIQGERAVLEPVGLWQTFSGWHGFLPPLLAWLRQERHEP